MHSSALSTALSASQPPVAAAHILQFITDSVICTDASGCILLFNRAAEESFGYSASEAIGASISMLLPERHRAQHGTDVVSFGLREGTANRLMGDPRKVLGLRKNGEEFAAEATISRHSLEGRTILTVVHRDITERRKSEEQREMMAEELDHRIKNVLSVVSALVTLTARSAVTVEELAYSLQKRLISLAATQELLARGRKTNFEIGDLIDAELVPFRSVNGKSINVLGGALALQTAAVMPLALVIHELATNAAKYGAFSQPDGRVTISIELLNGDDIAQVGLVWQETGGPIVRAPDRQGFGTALIVQTIKRVFHGSIVFDYPAEGLICRMTIPAKKMLEPEAMYAEQSMPKCADGTSL